MLEQSVLALRYVRVRTSARQAGAAADLSGTTVQMAFTDPDTDPVSGDWKTGSWDTDTTTSPDSYYARCLVGPGGTIALPVGTYAVHVKVTASPEVPVERAGLMKVV